jgi:site-specific recombinase XerD
MKNNTKFGNSTLFVLIHDYLKVYLPKQRKLSQNTIRSYRKSLELLVDYVKSAKKIPLGDVTFEMLTSEMVLGYLDYIELGRSCSVSTRNNRLAAIRAFLEYATDRDITTVAVLNEIKTIPMKKSDEIDIVDYMSMAAITALVSAPDTSTPKGMRDRFLMLLMYDTGARVQEIVDIELCSFKLGKTPTVKLYGKGDKVRTVPLMEKTAANLENYLDVFHKGIALSSACPLFYSVTHGEVSQLTNRHIRTIISGYGAKARENCLEVPERVHPHMLRHSRAMHLYQNGMDLILVSQWLGHKNLETTLIYVYADTEHKRRAIAAATPADTPLGAKLSPERFTVTDEDMLKRLSGLR